LSRIRTNTLALAASFFITAFLAFLQVKIITNFLDQGSVGIWSAVIAVGAVIRGATPHFDIVAGESAKALSSLALAHSLPVINAILTTDTIEQAIERAGTKAGNKGADAAMSAMEMISLLRKLK